MRTELKGKYERYSLSFLIEQMSLLNFRLIVVAAKIKQKQGA